MFEQAFKNIDDVLHKDAGCSSELDYVEQTSWLLFLKYLDDLEETRRMEAALEGKLFDPIIDARHGGYPPDAKHPTDMDISKIVDVDMDPTNKYLYSPQPFVLLY